MIASTAPKATPSAIKTPTVSSAPPLQFLQGGGQLSDYRFSSGPYAGMTVGEVRNLMGNFAGQVQDNFGPKQPKPITGSNSTDQAAGLIAGVGLPLAAGAAYNYFSAPAAASTTTGAGSAGVSSLGNLSLSNALGLGGSSSAGSVPATPQLVSTGAGQAGGGLAASLGGGAGTSTGLLAGGLAAGAATGYLQGKGIYDAAKGGNMDFASQAALALPTFGASFLYNPVKKMFGSSKAPERNDRKQGRLNFQNAGLMNPDSRSRYNLSDGSQFDIRDYKQQTGKDAYNVDWSGDNKNRDEQVGLTNVLANALVGGKGKVRSDMSGELYNAFNSNGNFDANAKAAFDKAGGRDAVYGSVAERWKQGQLSAAERDANFAAIDKLYGIKNQTNARWEDSQNLTQKDKDRNSQELAKGAQPQTQKAPQATTKPLPQESKATTKPIKYTAQKPKPPMISYYKR